MTPIERKVRFRTAFEIVENVFEDYCKSNRTREECSAFFDFVVVMQKFAEELGKEAEN